jgi:hypothetical protein
LAIVALALVVMANVLAMVPSDHVKPSHKPANAIGWSSVRAMA